MLEFRLWISWDLKLKNEGFYKIGNFSTLLFIASITFTILGSNQQLFIHQIVNLLPIVFYPLLLGEYYSNRKTIPLGALIYGHRKNKPQSNIKIGYLYFAIVLVAASVFKQSTDLFFIVSILLIAWALWHIKSSTVAAFKWLVIFTVLVFISYLSQYSLERLALNLEDWAVDYFDELFNGERDPFRSKTAMGRIGELKLSNKIVMRVKSENSSPVLLQEASYDFFYENVWFSAQSEFKVINKRVIGSTETAQLIIHRNTHSNRSLLALPRGDFDISVSDNIVLSRNKYGTTKAINTKKLFEYSLYTTRIKNKKFISKSDLIIPRPYREIISSINAELHLRTLDKKKAIQKISEYFTKNYRYSLYQEKLSFNQRPLIVFLSSKHRGHCEFFASATVLLLRSVGIPTRYIVGYSASEYDYDKKMFTVRARDSHAWAQAYIDHEWINVDNTPAIWYQEESANASIFEPLTDFFSQLYYRYNLWHQERDETNEIDYQFYSIMFTIILLLILFYFRKNNKTLFKLKKPGNNKSKINQHETQSNIIICQEFLQQVTDIGNQYGISRKNHEPLLHWLQRLQLVTNNTLVTKNLKEIILLYYQLRFVTDMSTDDSLAIFKNKLGLWLSDRNNSY